MSVQTPIIDVPQLVGRVHTDLLIDNQWMPPHSGQTLAVIDPGTGDRIADIAAGDGTDVDAAVAAARGSLEKGTWRRMTTSDRARVLWRIAELIDEHHDELTTLECLDQGQPPTHLTWMVSSAAQCFRYYAGLADQIYGVSADVVSAGAPMHAYTRKEPVGVVGLIVPWNAPLLMAAWKLAPMLAAGCSGVLKPAEETSLTALRLGELVVQAGVPAGVANIVTGIGQVAGAALAAHPDVDKISFTGSTEVGKRIRKTQRGKHETAHAGTGRKVAGRGLRGRRFGRSGPGCRSRDLCQQWSGLLCGLASAGRIQDRRSSHSGSVRHREEDAGRLLERPRSRYRPTGFRVANLTAYATT